MEGIVGIIYPIPYPLVERIKKRDKFFFVKNPTHEVLPKSLEIGDKILFYNKKCIVAEGIINSMVLMKFEDILSIKDTIQTKEELEIYSGSGFRRFKKQIVFDVSSVKNYNPPISCSFTITMVGQYIVSTEYKKLVS